MAAATPFQATDSKANTPDLGVLRLLALVRIGWSILWLPLLLGRNPVEALTHTAAALWQPVSLAVWFEQPPAPAYGFVLYVLALVAAVLLLLGVATRWTGPLTFITGTLTIAITMSWGKIAHDTQLYLLLLGVFCFSDWGACWSIDALIRRWRGWPLRVAATAWPTWPLWMGTFIFALLYVTSGLHKLLRGYFLDGGFVAYVQYQLMLGQDDPGRLAWIDQAVSWVLAHPPLGFVMALGALCLELGVVLALVSPNLRLMMLAGLWMLHGGIGVVSQVYFVSPILAAVLLFVPTLLLKLRPRSAPLRWLFPIDRSQAADARDGRLPRLVFTVLVMAGALALCYAIEPLAGALPLEGFVVSGSVFRTVRWIAPTGGTYLAITLIGTAGFIGFALFAIRQTTLRLTEQRPGRRAKLSNS